VSASELTMVDPRQDPTTADLQTVQLLKQRDQKGLHCLLATYGAKTKWYLRREFKQSLDDQGIHDALNQAAFRAWRFIATFDPDKGTLRAWFYKIARNAGLSILREQNKMRGHVQVDDWDLPSFLAMHHGDDAEPTPKHKQFLADLWRCIQGLSPLQKGIVLADLKAGDVADAGDLAESFHTSKNSIYVSRSMARKALRQGLIRLGHVPGDKGRDKDTQAGGAQAEAAQ
jgi:DNA-directed RNA polymerase specialized sigma24 family protein